MKIFKKVTGIVLSICLVITQFYAGEVKQVKAAEGEKTEITSSKLSFEYEKTGEGEAGCLKVCGIELDNFSGNGAYEADIAKKAWETWDETGYYNLGYIESDAEYILNNVTLIVNDTYRFILSTDTMYTWNDNGVYKVNLKTVWDENFEAEGEVVYTSKDGKATLVSGGKNAAISLYVENTQNKPGEGDTEKPGEGGDDTEKPGEGDTNKPGEGDDTEKPGEGDTTKPEKVKTEITSSKLVFTYEKAGETEAKSLKVCNTEVNGFNGNGTYEADIAEKAWETWDKTGYYNLGFVESDTAYTLNNVTLVVNGKYEFVLNETIAAEEKEGIYKVDFPNIWGEDKEGDVLFTSKDGKATLVSGGNNVVISLYVENTQETPGEGDDTEKPGEGDDTEKPGEGDDTEKPGEGDTTKPEKVKTEITSSKLVFTYEKTGETEATSLKVCNAEVNNFKGNGTYETDIAKKAWETWDETGYYNLGFIESDTAYTLKNVTLVVNGKYEFVLNETIAAEEKEGIYKVDFPNIWGEDKEGDVLFTSKDGKATLVSGGNNVVISLYVEDTQQKPGEGDDTEKPGGDGTVKPEMVKTEVTSTKLLFTYEKTGETEAKYLKVCGTEVNGFKGNGAYETDIAESAWTTWDKTGYYNLGFVESDAAYTLKNITLVSNGKYEFVLNETMVAEDKEGIYKIDFPNMWSGHKEGDILYTSKDKKATLVSGGNTAVISLCIDKSLAPTPKPVLSPYEVPSSGTTATAAPTTAATSNPTAVPTTEPAVPTVKPTTLPTAEPVVSPTNVPTAIPETSPSDNQEEPASPSSKPETGSDVQKGDKVNVSGQKYEVTNTSKNTVTYVAPKNSKKTSISVPATVKVTVNGKKVTYKVTSIKDKAFKGNKKIKTVTLSKNITSIGKDAFKNCGKLKTMVIKSTKITKVGKDAFKGTAKNLVIKVPAKKVSAYKKLFKNKGNKNIKVKKL